MADALRLNDTIVETLLAIPSMASLLVVFLAGQIGDRIGHRRTLIPLSLIFTLGGLLLATAQEHWSLGLGLAFCGSSAMAIQIVALALLQRTVPEGRAQAAAFTTYGMAFPIAYLIVPVATSALLDGINWRWIPLIWALAGLLIGALCLALLERQETRLPIGEWLSSLLAGVALATTLRLIDFLGQRGTSWKTPGVVLCALAIPIVIGVCAALMRRAPAPGFSLRPINGAAVRVLLVGVALASMLGTLSYVTIAAEYFYGLTYLQASLAMVPAQAGGIVGAKLVAGWAMQRWGLARAGPLLLLLLGAAMLPLLLLRPGTPLWFLITCSTMFSTLAMATATVFNTDVMGRAPLGGTGPFSAFRGAASSIGSALGVLLLAAGVTNAVPMDTAPGGATPLQLAQLAAALRIDGLQGGILALAGWLARAAIKRPGKGALLTSVRS